ncbi:MAG: dihydroorotate dehydrogenase electron transfer subunit [Spirochaetes bacterium]|nr:dihydroorotate dehydrogenase electron transfer subunit [Spirochaetota bacterium]
MAYLIEKPVEVARDHFLLRITSESVAKPGQFVNIKIGFTYDPLLRRPFSVYNYSDGIIEIVVRVVGRGTSWLRNHAQIGKIDMLPPMGKGFTIIESGRALLVGGGVGNAPLYYLAKALKVHGVSVEYVFGAQNADLVFLKEKYETLVDVFHITTDDGSCGEKGFATDCVRKYGEKTYDAIYTCGPRPMMAALVEMFRQSRALIEVSVENYFGCGIGLCAGCTVETVQGNQRACADGPVFDGRILLW